MAQRKTAMNEKQAQSIVSAIDLIASARALQMVYASTGQHVRSSEENAAAKRARQLLLASLTNNEEQS